MPFRSATQQQLAWLLSLFPVSHLRSTWPSLAKLQKTKGDLAAEIAANVSPGQIVNFVDAHLCTAKQHVYVFEAEDSSAANKPLVAPSSIPDGERVKGGSGRTLYIAERTIGAFLPANGTHEHLDLLWPVLVETTPRHVVVRFVTLEKNLRAFFNEAAYPTTKGLTEEEVLAKVCSSMGLKACDLHKGVKALWKGKAMDAHRTRYANEAYTASREMHGEKGIRKSDPVFFQQLLEGPLSNTTFRLDLAKTSVKDFTIDPPLGKLVFGSYSEGVGESDHVIQQILLKN